MNTILRASAGSWRKKDSPAVNRIIRVKGLLN